MTTNSPRAFHRSGIALAAMVVASLSAPDVRAIATAQGGQPIVSPAGTRSGAPAQSLTGSVVKNDDSVLIIHHFP